MKAVCPNAGPDMPGHITFETTAHVMELWQVDQEGNFLSVVESMQTDHGPDPDNIWTCTTCGADAKVTR